MDRRPIYAGAALFAFGYLPLMFLGPGTDLDVRGVYQSGRAILSGHYQVSRVPGSPVFETVTGVLHALGGSFLVNFASGVCAVALAVGVAVLIAREIPTKAPHAAWVGFGILLNPFVWVAGTSMVDFVWAMAALIWGALAQRRRHWSAAIYYALAVGVRASSALIVVAFILGDWWAAKGKDRLRLTKIGALTTVLAAVVYLPPFLTLGFDFLHSDVDAASLVSHLGRAAVKSWYFYGPVMVGLVLWVLIRRLPNLKEAWNTIPMFRMSLLGFLAVQMLFVRYPWKLAHLIPALVLLVVMGGLTRGLGRGVIGVFVASQLLLGAVNLNLANPDQPNAATSGRFAPQVLVGPLIKDVQCRLESNRSAYLLAPPDDEGGVGSDLLEVWACVVPWSK